MYGNTETTTKDTEDADLDEFCKAMGWTKICGVLPKKQDNKSKRHRNFEETDLNDVHNNFMKTDISKQMSTCVLKGIQAKRELKIPSEREAHRQRKVILISPNFQFNKFKLLNFKK